MGRKKLELKFVRIGFENDEQIELIKTAAARRGIGFHLFVRLALSEIAKNVMARPPDKIFGQIDPHEELKRSRAREKAAKASNARWSKYRARMEAAAKEDPAA
jgi:hypothetical protein